MPRISVVIVCRDEARALAELLRDLRRQTLPADDFEVLVVDSRSRDGTRRVAEEAARGDGGPGARFAVLDNPGLFLAPGWNAGIRAARAPAVLRLDAHARIPPDFLEASLGALERVPEAWAVGGAILSRGETFWGRVNAAVLSHPFGVGGSRFRTRLRGGAPGSPPGEGGAGGAREGGPGARPAERGEWVATVPYAAYRRWVFDRVGLLDERLRRGEDLELHARIRRAGGRFWLDPAIRSEYVARPTLSGLLRKAWGDGFWNPRAARLARSAMRPYHFAPPAFVLALAATLAASPWATLLPFLVLAGSYVVAAALAAADASRGRAGTAAPASAGRWERAVPGPGEAGGFLRFAGACWLAFALFHLARGAAAVAGLVSLLWWRPGRRG